MQLGSYAEIQLFVINMTEVLTHKLGAENTTFSHLSYKTRGLMNNETQHIQPQHMIIKVKQSLYRSGVAQRVPGS